MDSLENAIFELESIASQLDHARFASSFDPMIVGDGTKRGRDAIEKKLSEVRAELARLRKISEQHD